MTALRASLSTATARRLPAERIQDLALLQLCVIVLALVAMALRA
jgi:hypothetical protein